MNQFFLSLTQNAALLVSLSVIYGLLSRIRSKNINLYKILVGLLFGVIAIAGMNVPVEYGSGIIYDGRSVVLVLSGFFGGGLTSVITIIMTSLFRIYLGGTGTLAGISTIVSCAMVGLVSRRIFKQDPDKISLLNLWIMGIVAHIFMLLSQFILPWPIGPQIISKIWIPVIFVLPITSLLIGILLQTEEKRIVALSRIKQSEKRYQTLSENSPVGIFRARPDGFTTYVNPKWCELSGISFEDALGNGWLRAVHPEDRDKILSGWKDATGHHQKSVAEYRFLKKNGEVVWVSGVAVGEFNENKELVGYIGTVTDVTKRKQMEQALRENEANYRNLFENDSAIKLMTNPTTEKIINANKAASKFYGWTVDKLKTMSLAEIQLTNSKKNNKIQQNQKKLIEEFQHKLADGKVRNVEVFTSKIQFQGEVCNHSIIHDVTGKKQAEEKLSLMGKALEQSPVSITITDKSGTIEYVNPKFSEITGYRFEEVIGKDSNILNSHIHSNEFFKEMWDTISLGKDWIGEIKNKKKNGEYYWESQIISPIVDLDGEITNFISVKEDVSEQKRMIQEVIDAKEKAEEAERLKSAFLANMSHEIRTPLNAILGFTSMLTNNEFISEQTRKEYIYIINKSAEGLLQIINDILDISKLETGQVKIYKTRFVLRPIFEALLAQYQNKLEELQKTNLVINLFPEHIDTILFNDETRFIQICSNLLDNAIKFTESGEITFGVSSISDSTIEFEITDTGIGIKEKDQQTIFDRFRQVGDSLTRIHSGNGLGLAIVKSLVILMGGEIELESTVGEGTTFRFRFPL